MKSFPWTAAWCALPGSAVAGPPKPTLEPLVQVIDINVGQSQEVQLAGGKKVTVKLLDLKQSRDPLREAVREAQVLVEVNGRKAWLPAANYALPRSVGGVQIDCAITKSYLANCNPDVWGASRYCRRNWSRKKPSNRR
jgi:hypothetical protein